MSNTPKIVSKNHNFMPKSNKTINELLGEIGESNYKSDQSQTHPNPERLNKLNDTYRKRYIEYIKIILVIVIGLVCIWLCRILENMDYISSTISNIILTIILGFMMIINYIIYQNIQIHNLIIYDQIDYKSPELVEYQTAGPSTTLNPSPTSSNDDEKCPEQPPIIGNSISDKTYFS
jgi:hypothetical protein